MADQHKILVTALAFGFAGSLSAQESRPLWGELRLADTPEVVATKLSSLPEVKSAKVKPAKKGKEPSVSVGYKNGGLSILDDQFEVSTEFKSGLLSRVTLHTGETCQNDSTKRFGRLLSVLREKYPGLVDPALGTVTQGDLAQARIDVLNGLRGNRTVALTNDDTAVLLTIIFQHTDPPSYTYSSNTLVRSLNNLARSLYESRASACGGTGADRAVFTLTYMTDVDLRESLVAIEANDKKEREGAASKL